jgi:hypothetical protein
MLCFSYTMPESSRRIIEKNGYAQTQPAPERLRCVCAGARVCVYVCLCVRVCVRVCDTHKRPTNMFSRSQLALAAAALAPPAPARGDHGGETKAQRAASLVSHEGARARARAPPRVIECQACGALRGHRGVRQASPFLRCASGQVCSVAAPATDAGGASL